jgi:hypothetical protein
MTDEKRVTHTPGPWRVGDARRTVFGPPNGNPSPETIADIRKPCNAALIAAAPRMYDALKQIARETIDGRQSLTASAAKGVLEAIEGADA